MLVLGNSDVSVPTVSEEASLVVGGLELDILALVEEGEESRVGTILLPACVTDLHLSAGPMT